MLVGTLSSSFLREGQHANLAFLSTRSLALLRDPLWMVYPFAQGMSAPTIPAVAPAHVVWIARLTLRSSELRSELLTGALPAVRKWSGLNEHGRSLKAVEAGSRGFAQLVSRSMEPQAGAA